MGDLRIQKTREKLRAALLVLLREQSFEHLSVTDLCKRSGVSRITFYAYYDDKPALTAELFDEMFQTASNLFFRLQERKNPEGDPAASCRNLLSAVLEMQEQYQELMDCLALEQNESLAFAYYWYVLRQTEEYGRKYVEQLYPGRPAQMTTDFLCTGLWGFIRTGIREGRGQAELRAMAEELLDRLLRGDVLFEPVISGETVDRGS